METNVKIYYIFYIPASAPECLVEPDCDSVDETLHL